jgi:hypothetical protein
MKTQLKDLQPDTGLLTSIYRGVIEDRNDPEKLGRCKIRILGVHSESKNKDNINGIPTDELPWAEPALSLIEGSVSGFGLWCVPLQGSHVFVFFENGNITQPRYFASVPGLPVKASDSIKGFNDPDGYYPLSNKLNESDYHRLARNEKIDQTITEFKNQNLDLGVSTADGATWDEPHSAYNTQYPDNIVLATHVGITIEIDTTSGSERLHIYHPSGSYIEIDKEGNMVVRNSKNKFEIIDNDKKEHIVNNYDRTVDVNRTNKVGANETESIGGNRKVSVQQNFDESIGGNTTSITKGKVIIKGSTINLN